MAKYLDLDGLAYYKSKEDLLLANKVDKETGKGLSTNDYTTAEKTKLSGIETAAEVNVLEGVQLNGITITPTNKIANIEINVPTSTSELTNDSGFITNTVNNLTNYYTKTNTYTKSEIDSLIDSVISLDIQIVQTLPTQDISTSTIYLVPKTASTNDNYDEYIYVNNSWEHIGSTEVDLSNYYTKTQTDNLLNDKADSSDIPTKVSDLTNDVGYSTFSGSYNDLTNKPTIPTKTSDLTNDTGFIDNTYHDSSKQDTLVTGAGIDITNGVISNTQFSGSTTQAEGTNVTIENTIEGPISSELKGDTTQTSFPSRYTQVDYIQSSGSQYIDTLLKLSTTLDIDVEFEIVQTSGWQRIFGLINAGNSFQLQTNGGSVTDWRFSYSSTNYDISNITQLGEKTNFKFVSGEGLYVDDALVLSIPEATQNPNGSIAILKGYDRGSYIKLYNCKIWDNGILVRNLVPCYRNGDNEVGMYDLVNDIFYTNQGTGAFTYGSVVTPTAPPTPDAPIPIQTATGEQEIVVSGKNLFDYDNTTLSGVYGEIATKSDNGYLGGWAYIIKLQSPIKAGTYYLSFKVNNVDNSTTSYIDFRDINGSAVNAVNVHSAYSHVITFTKDVYSLKVDNGQNTSTTLIKDIMIEKGSTATKYEAYQGQSYQINLGNIELCKIGDYQDKIYKDSGKWYLEKKIGKLVLNGSENWSIWRTNTFYFNFNEALANEMCYCSHFIKVNQNQLLTNGIAFVQAGGGVQINIYPKQDFMDNYGTLEGFKNWLASNNPIVYYILATPTTTEITDTTLISQLNALASARSYTGQTNISVDGDLPVILDLEAYINNIPTKTSDLVNDSGYITTETDPVFSSSVASNITSTNISTWNNKLDTSKVKSSSSTTSGDVYDVTYINAMLGDIETILTTLTTGNGV